MHIRIQNSEISIQGLQSYSSNVSSNRIKIQVILLQLETDCFSKLFISEKAPFEAVALQSSQRLPELLFYTKKSYRILQLQFYKGTHSSTYNLHVHNYTTVYPENTPSRIQFYMQKTKSSLSTTTTTYRGQRDLHSRKEILRIEGKEIF